MIDNKHLNSFYSLVKSAELFGRYITNSDLEECLKKIPKSIISTVGYSVEKRPIYGLKFGSGKKRILLWSQMHGNESTTTKALCDCFSFLLTNNELPNFILESCSLFVIPILNPDGAERYTRLNANGVDLNRDAQDLSQPESVVLRQVFNDFKPHYCFNLHGQRTIYNVGSTNVPATLSFLSPAENSERSVTKTRKVAMSIISKINTLLQKEIPNGIGRYDDGFNSNCVGDTFQHLGVPTILYETGHLNNDYNREQVRRLAFVAIVAGLYTIAVGVDENDYEDYFKIPENGKLFYDVLIKNAKINAEADELTDVGILYEERLVDCIIDFIPKIESMGNLDENFGHKEIDAEGDYIFKPENSQLKVTNEIDFVIVNNEKISLKP